MYTRGRCRPQRVTGDFPPEPEATGYGSISPHLISYHCLWVSPGAVSHPYLNLCLQLYWVLIYLFSSSSGLRQKKRCDYPALEKHFIGLFIKVYLQNCTLNCSGDEIESKIQIEILLSTEFGSLYLMSGSISCIQRQCWKVFFPSCSVCSIQEPHVHFHQPGQPVPAWVNPEPFSLMRKALEWREC